MKSNKNDGGLVYSTEHGRMCKKCSKPITKCICKKQKASTPPADGVVRVSRQTKGRKGKGVTLITGVDLNPLALAKLGKDIKIKCGSGGTVKNGIIEIQGDHILTVMEYLKKEGYTVKRSGG
ncbi:MAG: translation initiation factor Sui1 [Magnetococcales bacterium]|nr:translation initiation factor Sui1 [Magnetococcales bacterium]